MAAITAAALTTAATVYATKKAGDQAEEQAQLAREGIAAADPYARYRPEAAAQLSALMKDPSKISESAEYKARQMAAARQLAAQGYTGSGNAIIEAANAAGESYQQAFNNLALLSGAGVSPGGGYGNALQANQAANDTKMSGYAGIANNIGNLAMTVGNRWNTGGNQQASSIQSVNKIATTPTKTFNKG